MNAATINMLPVSLVALVVSTSATAHNFTPDKPWGINLITGYENQQQVLPLGFLPPEQHSNQSGLSLRHLDVSRHLLIEETDLYGRITLSAHGNEVELDEAFLSRKLGKWRLTAGQQQPLVGIYNHQHEHNWAMNDLPLVYRALWGGQFSETGLTLWHQTDWLGWSSQQHIGLYSTEQFATQDASAAVLANSRFSNSFNQLSVTLGADIYLARLERSGMNLFSTDPTQHTHGSDFTDEFSGDLLQTNLMANLDWNTDIGQLSVAAEIQWRQSEGDLNSLPGQTLDATGNVEVDAYGGYSQISWKGNNGLLAGLRQQMLSSDVVLRNTATSDLDSSVLHNPEGTVNGTSLMLGYDFADRLNSRIKLQLNQNSTWAENDPSVILTFHQGLSF